MARGEAAALGVEREAADCGGIGEAMRLSPLAKHDGLLADAGDDGA